MLFMLLLSVLVDVTLGEPNNFNTLSSSVHTSRLVVSGSHAHAVLPINASIVYGVLYTPGNSPQPIGNTTSAISSSIQSIFAPIALPNADLVILKNSTIGIFNFVNITGTYVVDSQISLLTQLIVVLQEATFVVPPTYTGTSVFNATQTPYSGVVSPGGPSSALISCANPYASSSSSSKQLLLLPTTTPIAVYSGQSAGFLVDGLTIEYCGLGTGASIHLKGIPMVTGGEVANCIINNAPSRGIWTETIVRAVIHDNIVFNASLHSIDFDAFSSNSVAYNNTVSYSREEAIFIEQAATNIVVSGNTLGPANSCGIAVYNNAINDPTSSHVIVGNRIFGSLSRGISVGSTSPKSGTPDLSVLIAGNILSNNGGQGIHTNGGQIGTIYVGNNDATDGVSLYTLGAGNGMNISFMDPMDRVRVAKQ